jgi:hypothetical protein
MVWQTESKSTKAHLFFDSCKSFHSVASGALQKIMKYVEQSQPSWTWTKDTRYKIFISPNARRAMFILFYVRVNATILELPQRGHIKILKPVFE